MAKPLLRDDAGGPMLFEQAIRKEWFVSAAHHKFCLEVVAVLLKQERLGRFRDRIGVCLFSVLAGIVIGIAAGMTAMSMRL